MSILRLDGVRREIGDFVILDSVSAALARGERVGLVGANGAGKTTLLKIVDGREEADGGKVHIARTTRVGLLTQEANLDGHFSTAPSVRAIVRGGAVEVERMELALAEMEAQGAAAVQSAQYGALRERFEAADGYHLDQRVEESLAGLGIPRDRWDVHPSELSGGEQTRVALARLLTADPDLLMLDEPTNHLDIDALEWLETALVRRSSAVLVASHDRVFLDNVVGRIWEIRHRRLTTFKGAYSAFLIQREAADARMRSQAGATSAAMAREVELVQRYRSQRKHVKMHEHERRLEQLRASQTVAPRKSARLSLPGSALSGDAPARSAEVAVSLEDLLCGYGPTTDRASALPIAKVSRLEARRGERIGLVGPNGAGKSTLLRTIAGQLRPLEGFVRIGRNVMPGYLSQLRDRPMGGLDVLGALMAAAPVTPGVARSYLARFLFRGDEVSKPVSELSGGERSRLELALLGVGSTNLLLLDEPTNHLDIPAREALEAFLRDSESTLIVVSHDRRLLESICQRLWVVGPGSVGGPALVAPFDGGYREWRAAVTDGWTVALELDRRPGGASSQRSGPTMTEATRPVPRRGGTGRSDVAARADAAPKGPRLSKDAYRREHRRVEEDLSRLQERKSVLEAGLGDPAIQANYIELRRLGSELADVDGALSQAEDAWLTLEERAPR
ncbi:MAG: ABC-F family ATP-binding cassette domain-containing protein [Chloroflexota bacterium]